MRITVNAELYRYFLHHLYTKDRSDWSDIERRARRNAIQKLWDLRREIQRMNAAQMEIQ